MNFDQDWFMRHIEKAAEGAARKAMNKPTTQEQHHGVQHFGGDDLVFCQLCELIAKHRFCAAEDLLWEHLRPGDETSLALAEEIYRQLGEFSEETLNEHNFSRQEVRDGLVRAKHLIDGEHS